MPLAVNFQIPSIARDRQGRRLYPLDDTETPSNSIATRVNFVTTHTNRDLIFIFADKELLTTAWHPFAPRALAGGARGGGDEGADRA
jgi:hypothetical protein